MQRHSYAATYAVFDNVFLLFLALVAIDLNTQIVAFLLPVQATLLHREQVLLTEGLARRDADDADARGHVTLLGRPVADVVVGGRPGEVVDALHLDALLVQQAKRLQTTESTAALNTSDHRPATTIAVVPNTRDNRFAINKLFKTIFI